MADTIWGAWTAIKLILQSGQFASTIKDSEYVAAVDNQIKGITNDFTDTPWMGHQADKFYLNSGQFTSTLKTSMGFVSIEFTAHAFAWAGTDILLSGGSNDKLFLLSGEFTSTIKTSEYVGGIDGYPVGITYDGINTPWAGQIAEKLYLQSGQFTSTLKDSEYIGGTGEGSQRGISYDGTDTPWGGLGTNKMYLQSGQFTSTIKTSITVFDNQFNGIDMADALVRLPVPPVIYEAGEQALSLTAHDPTILTNIVVQLSPLSLSAGQGAVALVSDVGILAAPIGLALAVHDPAIVISVTVEIAAPLALTTAIPAATIETRIEVEIPSALSLSAEAVVPEISLEQIVLAEALSISAALPAFGIIASSNLLDKGMSLGLTLLAPKISVGNDVRTIVTNTRNFAISEYVAFAYNSMCKFNGKYLYAKADGIYEGGGDDDDGRDIDASYKTGSIDTFATEVQKLRNAFCNFRSNGDIQLFSVGDKIHARSYTIINSTIDTIHERRVKFERGIRQRHFNFGVSNINGSTLEVDSIKILTEPVRKRR